jgi:predicted anti-sigma-YlaC factor YlaD
MFDREIFKAVVGEIDDTREQEKLGCDDCFDLVDRFIEAELSGLTAAEAMPLVHEHLYICGECRDEFGALLEALRAAEGPSNRTTEALDRLWRSVTPRYAR